MRLDGKTAVRQGRVVARTMQALWNMVPRWAWIWIALVGPLAIVTPTNLAPVAWLAAIAFLGVRGAIRPAPAGRWSPSKRAEYASAGSR